MKTCGLMIAGLLSASLAWGADPAAAEAQPDIADLQRRLAAAEASIQDLQTAAETRADAPAGLHLPGAPQVLLHGEGGLAWFENQNPDGSPDDGFRVDEAQLNLEAELHRGIYLSMELLLVERESPDDYLRLGELYVDFEDPLGEVLPEGLVCFRAGRFDVPFGEEYRTRDALDNPLVSHSAADFWGIDEGVGLYGKAGRFDHVLAVQNGGDPTLAEGNNDKAVIARLGWQPVSRLRLSVSAMRTGDLDPEEDETSEEWFGNGVFIPIGAPETTRAFSADAYEADVRWRWQGGYVAAFAGCVLYTDDDAAADNDRDATFYSVEGVQDVAGGFFAAARFSGIDAEDGFPVIGQGQYGRLLSPPWVEDLQRLSVGAGYRWSRNLVLKAEYSIERGDYADGTDLEASDLASVELAFGF